MTTPARIRWTSEERLSVLVRLRQYYLLHPEASIAEAISHAQMHLPSERQRPITQSASTNFADLARDAKRELRAESPTPPDQVILPGSVVRVEVPVVLPAEQVLAQTPSSLLIATLFERLTDWITRSQNAWLASKEKAPVASAPSASPPPRYPTLHAPLPARLRIGVAGMLRPAFQRIAEAVDQKCELCFINGDQSKPDAPIGLDYLIATAHVRHDWSTPVKEKLGDRYIIAHSSQTDVIQKIYDLLSKQPARTNA